MDFLVYIIEAFRYLLFNPVNLSIVIIGAFIGILSGALPGTTSVSTVPHTSLHFYRRRNKTCSKSGRVWPRKEK